MADPNLDLGIEYTGGIAKPTPDQVGFYPRVAVDQYGDPNFEYVPVSPGGGSGSAAWKDPVRVATAAAMAASTRVANVRTANANGALAAIDGVSLAVGDALLDQHNATGADRGVWVVTSLGSGGTPWVLTRRSDFDNSLEVLSGLRVAVTAGSANAGKTFALATANPIVLNTTSLTFSESAGGGAGDVVGPASSVAARIAVFSDTTGKLIADGGTTIAAIVGAIPASDGGAPLSVAATGAAGGSAGTWSRSDHKHQLADDAVTTVKIANDQVTMAKLADIATDKLIGRDAASSGDPTAIGVGGGIEFTGSDSIQVSDTLPARGGENVAIDAYPSAQAQGTIANGATVTATVAIASGKRYNITCDVWVDDGAGGAVLFTKILTVVAHQTGGAAVVAMRSSLDNGGAGFTLLDSASSTNVVFSLLNTSGSTRSYNLTVGRVVMDKP